MVKTKKGVTAATISHPNSRKAVQLTRQVKKIENRKKTKNFHLMKQNMDGIKCLWFRDRMDPNTTECTREMLANLIEQYLGRFDEELQQIKLKNSVGQRKNRQHANREDIIELTQLQERNDYNNAGIELPDILNKKQLSILLNWNGQLRFLQNFKMRRFNKAFLTAKSKSSGPSPEEMSVETREDAEGNDKMESDESIEVTDSTVESDNPKVDCKNITKKQSVEENLILKNKNQPDSQELME